MQPNEDNLKLIRRHILLQNIVTEMDRERVRLETQPSVSVRGLRLRMHDGLTYLLRSKLQRSRDELRQHRIWVDSRGHRDGDIVTYRYACAGRQGVFPMTVDGIRTGIVEAVEEIAQAWGI